MSVGPKTNRSWTPSGTETLQGRYRVSYSHKLGEGSFARVYKGLDVFDNRVVAVKVYKYIPDSSDFAKIHEDFTQLVEAMITLGRGRPDLDRALARDEPEGRKSSRLSFDPSLIEDDVAKFHGTREKAKEIISSMDLKNCFVQLLGYSTDTNGRPGLDIDSEKFFVVTEPGEESLAESLSRHADLGTTLTVEDLRSLQWSLVSIVCGLHAAGFVHLDIKPCNVMRFGEVWKLIDFDGAVRTQSTVNQDRCFVSPWYLAPEIARCRAREITVSRLMDVWSVGMCALEAVFLQPVLRPWYEEWQTSTGCDDKFYSWLGDYDTPPIMGGDMLEAMADIDYDMSELLQGMLAKDPSQRLCIAECLVHPWFERIRSRMWMDMASPFQSQASRNPGAQVISPVSAHQLPRQRGCPEPIITPRNGVPGVIYGGSSSIPVECSHLDRRCDNAAVTSRSSSLLGGLQTVSSHPGSPYVAGAPLRPAKRDRSRMCAVM